MKIQVLSDLHIEFENLALEDNDADVVVLAGDIHLKDKGVTWALENIKLLFAEVDNFDHNTNT